MNALLYLHLFWCVFCMLVCHTAWHLLTDVSITYLITNPVYNSLRTPLTTTTLPTLLTNKSCCQSQTSAAFTSYLHQIYHEMSLCFQLPKHVTFPCWPYVCKATPSNIQCIIHTELSLQMMKLHMSAISFHNNLLLDSFSFLTQFWLN